MLDDGTDDGGGAVGSMQIRPPPQGRPASGAAAKESPRTKRGRQAAAKPPKMVKAPPKLAAQEKLDRLLAAHGNEARAESKAGSQTARF